MDPLLLLHSTLTSNGTITLLSFPDSSPTPLDPVNATEVYDLPSCTHIAFPSISSSLPRPILIKTISTRYTSTGTGEGDCYDLQTLLFAYLKRDENALEYIKICREKNLVFVSVTERKAILDFLSGRTNLESVAKKLKPIEGEEVGGESGEIGTGREESSSGLKRSSDLISSTSDPKSSIVEVGPVPAKKVRYIVDKQDQEKVKRLMSLIDGPEYGNVITGNENKVEKSGGAYRTKETVLRGERINNFESAKILVGPRIKLAREAVELAKSNSSSKGVPAVVPVVAAGGKPQRKKILSPIIMISPSSTALITMYNVKKFLEESIFESSEVARNASYAPGSNSSRLAEDVIVVDHARNTTSLASSTPNKNLNGNGSSNGGNGGSEVKKARYYVVDGVEALSKFGGIEEAWERVVCVMTTGQEWQFKPYKWNEPKELFHHVKGIHVQWTTDKVNEKVRGWNVTELKIDQNKRHIDKSTVADFWRTLENFIATKKPFLHY